MKPPLQRIEEFLEERKDWRPMESHTALKNIRIERLEAALIEECSKAAKYFLEQYAQGICEEFNMGDILREELLLKLRTHEKMMDRLLAKIGALKTKKAGEP